VPQQPGPLAGETAGHLATPTRRIAFEENVGQTDSRVRFVARAGSATAFVLPDALVVRTSRKSTATGAKADVAAAVRLQFEGAAPNAPVSGEDMLPGQAHYFIGSDSSRWHSGVRTYGRVRASNVYEGVDAVYYEADGDLEYDFVVAPHADPAQIRFAITGGESVSVDETGDLVIKTPAGDLRQRAPRLYQETGSGRIPVSGGFRMLGAGRVGIAVGGYDPGRPLVIDPVVDFGTRIGGSLSDTALDVAVDASGAVYAVGYSSSVDFPVTVGVLSEFRGSSSDAFVTKLDASGQVLLFSAYVGGSGLDLGQAIALAADGGVVVCGYTSSSDFPVAAGVQPAPGNPAGGGDGFVLKLTATGSTLTYATYLGGSGDDSCMDVAAVGDGSIVVCGSTWSSDLPTQLPLFGYSGGRDAFVARIAAGGSAFVFSTFLGGSLSEEAASVSIDINNNILVAGSTETTFEFPTPAIPFPVVNAVTPVFGGQTDAFAAKLSPTGQVLYYSTPLGGRGVEYAYDTCVDASGSLYVVGLTASTDFPVAGPVTSSLASGSTDGFVTKLSPAGDALTFSRFIGGTGSDALYGAAILENGSIAAFGYSNSTDVPLANEFQSSLGGSADGLMVVLSPTDGAAQTVSYFGDTASESFSSVASDPTGGIIALMNAGGPVFPGGGNAEFGPGGGSDPLVYRFYLEDLITPPTSPASLSATPASPFRISLAWSDTSGVETAIAIERRDGPAAPWIQIALTGPNVVSFNDDTVSASSTYSYRVRNIAGPDRSDPSNEVDATTPASSGLPVAPSFLSAAPVAGPHVALGWSDASADETGFEVERRLEPAGPWVPIGTSAANVASFRDVSPTVPATLGYRVRAVNGTGPSAWSNTAVVTTVNPPTPPPAAPIVEQDVNDSSRVKISWTAATGVVSSYRIERRVGADPTWRLILSASTQSTTTSDDDVNRDVTYHYRVRSANSAGVSAPTPEASVTVLPPNPPLNLVAQSSLSTQVSLNWNAPVGFANGYFVERRVGAVGPFDRVSPVTGARFYGDVSASPGTTYTYRVRSLFGTNPDTGIASDPSNEVTITTPGAGSVGATIAVNTNADGNARDAVVTLREAILIANGSLAVGSLTPQEQAAVTGTPLLPGLDVVAFAIPGPGPHTISLTSVLPDVVDTIKIDGTTQAGFAGNPVVEISGSAVVAANTTGLRLLAPRSVIIGLAVGGFTGNGILAGADEVVVSRCHAGVGPSGTTANANGGSGIVVQGGLACFVDRCVASGNAVAGIEVAGPGTGDTKVTGCKLGTNAAGTAGLANGTGLLAGVDSGLVYVGGPAAAERCVVSGNTSHGVLAQSGSFAIVAGSHVGVDATGAAALSNGGDGINAQAGSCRIERGNVISANGQAGLRLTSATQQSLQTLIRGSKFGVSADGRAVLGNAGPGIAVVNSTSRIGSTLAQDANVIAGNGGGGLLMVGSPFRSVIQGNFIGTNAFGDALGQPGDGIRLDGASYVAIGDGGAAARNTIAFTGGAGIAIPTGSLNWIRWNSIYATGGLPIDLGPTGPTENDTGDGDTGGNDLQNAPVLTGAMLNGPATIVTGYVESLPSADIRIELVHRPGGVRPSSPLAVVDVTTDANGRADFSVSFVATVESGARIAALATHRSLSGEGNTSELSNATPVQGVVYGSDTPGIFIGNTAAFFLKNASAPGGADIVFTYGPSPSSFVPIVGDWNGDGVDSGGLYDPATGAFFLRNTNTPGPADLVFTYGGGGLGLKPLAGDWNGDGVDTIGLYAPSTGAFFLRNSNSPGGADLVFTYGAGGAGVRPVIGDWNADGIDTVGIYLDSTGAFLLRNANTAGGADLVFTFGAGGAGIVPVTGDWNGDGMDSIGIYGSGSGFWFLKNLNTGGAADFVFGYGPPAVPLTGDWDGPGL
jgi:hypothetical protein